MPETQRRDSLPERGARQKFWWRGGYFVGTDNFTTSGRLVCCKLEPEQSSVTLHNILPDEIVTHDPRPFPPEYLEPPQMDEKPKLVLGQKGTAKYFKGERDVPVTIVATRPESDHRQDDGWIRVEDGNGRRQRISEGAFTTMPVKRLPVLEKDDNGQEIGAWWLADEIELGLGDVFYFVQRLGDSLIYWSDGQADSVDDSSLVWKGPALLTPGPWPGDDPQVEPAAEEPWKPQVDEAVWVESAYGRKPGIFVRKDITVGLYLIRFEDGHRNWQVLENLSPRNPDPEPIAPPVAKEPEPTVQDCTLEGLQRATLAGLKQGSEPEPAPKHGYTVDSPEVIKFVREAHEKGRDNTDIAIILDRRFPPRTNKDGLWQIKDVRLILDRLKAQPTERKRYDGDSPEVIEAVRRMTGEGRSLLSMTSALDLEFPHENGKGWYTCDVLALSNRFKPQPTTPRTYNRHSPEVVPLVKACHNLQLSLNTTAIILDHSGFPHEDGPEAWTADGVQAILDANP